MLEKNAVCTVKKQKFDNRIIFSSTALLTVFNMIAHGSHRLKQSFMVLVRLEVLADVCGLFRIELRVCVVSRESRGPIAGAFSPAPYTAVGPVGI